VEPRPAAAIGEAGQRKGRRGSRGEREEEEEELHLHGRRSRERGAAREIEREPEAPMVGKRGK